MLRLSVHSMQAQAILNLMKIAKNVSLDQYSTMRLGGKARFLCEVKNADELKEAYLWAKNKNIQFIVIGIGSNIIWQDKGFEGLVIVNKILGFETTKKTSSSAVFRIGSGENWDNIVKKTVDLGYSGIEQLSLIPGTVGATPVQNVGAYGREISDVLESVEALNTKTNEIVNISNEDCQFGYRTSRFKTTDRGRFLITSITIKLTKTSPKPPFYQSLQAYLDENKITTYTPKIIRDAVIAIRTAKMPDPSKVANNGSFFANPIISQEEFAQLEIEHPRVAHWKLKDGKVKISAAWLVENAGFGKNYHDQETGMATWQNHSLVLINEKAKSTQDLIDFRDKIIQTVHSKFGIKLEQEPEII